MREIKFRGKSLDSGKWIYGYVVGTPTNIYIIPSGFDGSMDHCAVEVDSNTIGEWTALKDKNGKEIYEGDIVLNNGSTSQMAEQEIVKFIDGGMYPFALLAWECTIDPEICEIIGNIYENPELVEGNK